MVAKPREAVVLKEAVRDLLGGHSSQQVPSPSAVGLGERASTPSRPDHRTYVGDRGSWFTQVRTRKWRLRVEFHASRNR